MNLSIRERTKSRIEKVNREGLKESKRVDFEPGAIIEIEGYFHDMFDPDIYYFILDGGWQLTLSKTKFQFIHDKELQI